MGTLGWTLRVIGIGRHGPRGCCPFSFAAINRRKERGVRLSYWVDMGVRHEVKGCLANGLAGIDAAAGKNRDDGGERKDRRCCLRFLRPL